MFNICIFQVSLVFCKLRVFPRYLWKNYGICYMIWMEHSQIHYILVCPLAYAIMWLRPNFFCQTQKKKSTLVSNGWKWFGNFLSDSPPPPPPQNKKKKVQVLRIFIVRVIQSTTGIYQCCSRASDLRMYISQTSGYRDSLIDIDWFYWVKNRLLETSRYQS